MTDTPKHLLIVDDEAALREAIAERLGDHGFVVVPAASGEEALERVAADRSTLVIAHRLSTIVGADRIIVLHEGSVVESGRHEELIAHGGRYAELWELQGREAAEEGVSA